MLSRSMAWFVAFMLLIGAVTPMQAAPPPSPTPAALTKRVYIPIASASLTRPDWVRVQSDRRYATSDEVVVVGEVTNVGSVPVYGVELEATFFDAAGESVGTANDYALFERTAPQERTPFRLVFTDAPAQVVRHEVRVVNWSTTTPFNPQPLVVAGQRTRTNEGLEVFGDVRNPSTYTLGNNKIAATLYDANGKVLDVVEGFTGRTQLAPNSTTVYAANIVEPVPYTTLRVQGEGYVIDKPTATVGLRIPHWRPFDVETDGGTTRITVSEAINDATTTVYNVEVEARYYDAAGQLVAVATSYGGSARAGLARMTSGQKNPFEIALANAPANIARTTITATAYGTTRTDYRSVALLSHNDRQAADGPEVVGRVQNKETVALERAYVAVTYYASDGTVADVAFGAANVDDAGNAQPLAGGAAADFVAFNGRPVTYATYLVQAEGYVASNAPVLWTGAPVQHD